MNNFTVLIGDNKKTHNFSRLSRFWDFILGLIGKKNNIKEIDSPRGNTSHSRSQIKDTKISNPYNIGSIENIVDWPNPSAYIRQKPFGFITDKNAFYSEIAKIRGRGETADDIRHVLETVPQENRLKNIGVFNKDGFINKDVLNENKWSIDHFLKSHNKNDYIPFYEIDPMDRSVKDRINTVLSVKRKLKYNPNEAKVFKSEKFDSNIFNRWWFFNKLKNRGVLGSYNEWGLQYPRITYFPKKGSKQIDSSGFSHLKTTAPHELSHHGSVSSYMDFQKPEFEKLGKEYSSTKGSYSLFNPNEYSRSLKESKAFMLLNGVPKEEVNSVKAYYDFMNQFEDDFKKGKIDVIKHEPIRDFFHIKSKFKDEDKMLERIKFDFESAKSKDIKLPSIPSKTDSKLDKGINPMDKAYV